MNLDVLMPYRAATPWRKVLHDWTIQLWQQLTERRPGVRVIVADDGQDGDLFSPARAVNNAFRESTADYVLIEGSGHIPHTDQHLDWLTTTLEQHPWLGAYAGLRELTEQATRQLVDTAPGDLDPATLPHRRRTPYAIGILAMRRDVFIEVGGMDERFNGWGYEDTALRELLTKLHGKPPEPQGVLTTLWHPPSTRRNLRANAALFKQQQRIRGNRQAITKYLDQRGRFV